MLDKTSANVLHALNNHSKENSYVIIKNTDITPDLPKRVKLNEEGINDTVSYLAEREYIKLKYAEEGTYCLIMLPKGRLFNEDRKEQKIRQKQENKANRRFLLHIAFVSALFSFAGAAFAIIALSN